ncbi:DGQHR domain-containing protein DpdB [Corallococcus sp. bb12-1]|uniref:DGQHR domain-containing protein DpdB n=1 Tax=Corallococcus sp. bb12-1 TaxID=2996784 RepID=UPI00226F2AA1|nr:DGQHR domain-containing protein DpdB [Corallococcus sp. bb12-1]MCY1047584.1 DGQHR domain-containing protein DpdB [Corallococcus sp. bb12-1]
MSAPIQVALVGCGKAKLTHPAPARDLYTGPLFRAHFAEAEATTSHVYVVSALHGLLPLAARVEPYDFTFRGQGRDYSAAWGRLLLESLTRLYPAGAVDVLVYAGRSYAEPLHDALAESSLAGWTVKEPLKGAGQGARLRILCEARRVRAAARAPLRLPALEVEQTAGRRLYLFAVDGKQVPAFATVSRVRRRAGVLEGYQRPEVLSHVAAIRSYMESAAALVPNAVVFAFDSRARFEPLSEATGGARHGHLIIPRAVGPDAPDAPGFIVDGQQRLAAVRDAAVESFPLACTGFITDDVGQQAEQFILVNSTKPLPKGLIHELLPSTHGALPAALERKRLPAQLVARLNLDEGSSLKGLLITQTCPAAKGKEGKGGHTAVIKDTSMMQALEDSLADGALFDMERAGEGVDAMVARVSLWWAAVASTWPDAWARQPKESRLSHGAGVRALSLLMDAACQFLAQEGNASPTQRDFEGELSLVADACAWTSGEWAFPSGARRWKDVQNTPKEVAQLATHLGALYRARRAAKPHRRTRKAGAA